jgi:hypothetical protein
MWDTTLGTATPASASVNTSGNGLQYALLGLAGVLVGALITGGFNFLVAWRKERADAAAESQRHDVEVRRAARLIDDDLHAAAGAARWCVEHKVFPAQQLTTVGWQQYRDVLAPELSDTAWQSVNVAVAAIDALQMIKGVHANIHRAGMAVDPKTEAMLETAIEYDLDVFVPTPVPDAAVASIKDLLWGLDNGRAALAPLMQDKLRD